MVRFQLSALRDKQICKRALNARANTENWILNNNVIFLHFIKYPKLARCIISSPNERALPAARKIDEIKLHVVLLLFVPVTPIISRTMKTYVDDHLTILLEDLATASINPYFPASRKSCLMSYIFLGQITHFAFVRHQNQTSGNFLYNQRTRLTFDTKTSNDNFHNPDYITGNLRDYTLEQLRVYRMAFVNIFFFRSNCCQRPRVDAKLTSRFTNWIRIPPG